MFLYSLQLALEHVVKMVSKGDIDLALKEMLVDHLALPFLNLKWNPFLATPHAKRIASGQIGETGTSVIETMDGELRLEQGLFLSLENMEGSHASRMILWNKGNVLFKPQDVDLKNGQNGVHLLAQKL